MRTPTLDNPVLLDEPKYLRSPVAYGLEFEAGQSAIQPNGGVYDSGLIRRAAIITRGEALGHGEWIDDTMLGQVTDAINSSQLGIKSRFAHPSMSGDGIGKILGRYMNATNKGGVVRADLHILSVARETEDKSDLGDYIMRLAAEAPDAFGNSISFEYDQGEQNRFMAENEDENGRFVSPDKKNKNNYPHIRLAKLIAADVVDDPAANPDGMFHRGFEMYSGMDKYISYILGLSDEQINLSGLPHVERIKAYVRRYFDANGLRIAKANNVLLNRIKLKALKARAQKDLLNI